MKQLVLLAAACLPIAAQAPDPVAGPLNRAYQALRAGDPVGAVAYLRDARALEPTRASIARELGYALLQTGDSAAAAAAFDDALRLEPDHAPTALQLGFLERAAGREAEAGALFERAVRTGAAATAETARRALAQTPADPLHAALERAYTALRAGELDAAAAGFRAAAALDASRADIRKELAYALLRAGETEAARDAFAEAVGLDPSDERAALELSYLRFETGERAEALAGFEALAASADPSVAADAEAAAARIRAELSGAIDRWEQAAREAPENRSARTELAELYLRRNRPEDAAREYLAAWRLPGANRDELLVRMGRARFLAGDFEAAHGAWLLASRSAEVRVAETARDLLPRRFPWANEFRAALALDPGHLPLRKELAYLLLQVGLTEEAMGEFAQIVERDPKDLQAAAQLSYLYVERGRPDLAVALLEKARASGDAELSERAAEALRRARDAAAELGERSLEKSYLFDALRQFQAAWEADPSDLSLALRLGVVHNLLAQDREALRWFRLAADSADEAVAEQAWNSYRNLSPQYRRATTTVWAFPFYSRRFGTVFGYGQAKTEFRVGSLPFRPYLSARVAGDARRRALTAAGPRLLSESSVIAAVGVRAPLRRGVTLWGEAGQSISYLDRRPDGAPRAAPDYRGGLNWFRARGPSLGSSESGFFHESNLDAVYLSRFNDDFLGYFQYRPGYTLPRRGPLRAQIYWNWNLTADTGREYWANTWESGPGVRFRVPVVRPPMNFSIDFVRGVHLSNRGNPLRPNYFDLRAGVWYSFSR